MKKKCLIGIFLAMLILPNLAYALIKDGLDFENLENRTMAVWPKFSFSGVASYPSEVEDYINDHAAFKPQLMSFYTTVNRRLFDGVPSSVVIGGKDNWLFYSDGHALQDYRGMDTFPDDQLAFITQGLLTIRDAYRAKGIEFVFFIAPNKASIYGQYMPDYYFKVSDESRADELVRYLQEHTDLTVVYPKETLLEKSDDYLLYYKSDTHWNHLGGFIGTQELIKTLTGTYINLEDIRYDEVSKTEGDLGKLLNLPKKFYDDFEYFLEHDSYRPEQQEEAVMLFLGDSFSYSMSLVLETYYENLHILHHESFESQDVSDIQPDIFVFEVVERNLDDIFSHIEALMATINE